jgi:hypothetical protein
MSAPSSLPSSQSSQVPNLPNFMADYILWAAAGLILVIAELSPAPSTFWY